MKRLSAWLDARPVVAAILAAEVAAFLLVAHWMSFAGSPHLDSQVGVDYRTYMVAADNWLSGDGFYWPWQLTGPYDVMSVDPHPILYPPYALVLFVPFAVVGGTLAAMAWWIVPLAITVSVVIYHRPRPAVWALLAFLVLCKWTAWLVASGNPVMWSVAAIALGTVWHWPSPLALLKPTVLPFALVGIRDRGWWVTLAIGASVALLFLPMWPQYVTATLNGQVDSFEYVWANAFPMAIPVVAWLARRPREAPDTMSSPSGF